MRILRLQLRGAIGIKKGLGVDEIEVDFTNFQPGLIALTGRNGSGKTTIMENLHPYRTMVSRDGSLQSHFFLKDSYRILTFELNGERYRSSILIDALTGGSEAYLIQLALFHPEGVALNDGKVTTYDKAIEDLLGSQELFFNSVFSGQKSKGIAALKPADRRKLFYELLNLNSYEEHCEKAKWELTQAAIKLAEFEGEIKAVTAQTPTRTIIDLLKEKDETQKLIAVKNDEIEWTETRITALNSEIQKLQVEARLLEDKQNQNDEILANIDNLKSDVILLTNEHNVNVSKQQLAISNYKETIKKFETTISKKREIEGGIATLEAKNAEINLLQEKRTKLFERNAEIQKEYSDAHQVARIKELDLDKRVEKLNQLETVIRSDEKDLANAEKQTSLISEVPCEEQTGLSCQFLKNAYNAKELVPAYQNRIKIITAELEEMKEENLKISKHLTQEREMIEERYKVAQSELSELPQITVSSNNLAAEINILHKQDFPAQAKLLQEAELNLVLYKEKITSAESTIEQYKVSFDKALSEIKSRIDELTAKLDTEIEAKIDTISGVIISHQEALKSYQSDKTIAESNVHTFNGICIQLDRDIEAIMKNQAIIIQLENDKTQVESDIRDWTFLCKAFDKTGIPVLKLENSGIEITSIANDLLSLFENKFRIVFETTSLTKDKKKMKETFDINIIEEDGVCEIGNKSGGQQVWLETAIQLAIMILLSSQGKKVETAFLDEKDGALDLENAYAYIEMLKKAHQLSGVHNTFVITHRTELLDFIPQQVKLTNGILEVIN